MATWKWYINGLKAVESGAVDLDTDTIHCSLHTVTYVPNQDTDDFFNDATNEVTGTGYTAGGVALGAKTLTIDGATNEIRWDFNDPSWTNATITGIRVAVLSKRRGGASSLDDLIGYSVLDSDNSPGGANFALTIAADGALKLTAAA